MFIQDVSEDDALTQFYLWNDYLQEVAGKV